MTNFINLTPHELNIIVEGGDDIVLPPAGKIARVAVTPGADIAPVGGIPLRGAQQFGEVCDLPNPEPGVFYVVSGLVASRLRGRDDVLVPDTGPDARRNDKGQITGVRRLTKAC